MKAAKVALTGMLTSLGVVLSYVGSIPIGPVQVFPFQSMINVLAGIMLGPWYAVFTAVAISVLRISLHTGTFFSLPGSIPGALLVGLTYALTKNALSAFAEIPGTALIGAFLSSAVVAPLVASKATFYFFVAAFIPPAVVGSAIGFVIVLALERRRVLERISL